MNNTASRIIRSEEITIDMRMVASAFCSCAVCGLFFRTSTT